MWPLWTVASACSCFPLLCKNANSTSFLTHEVLIFFRCMAWARWCHDSLDEQIIMREKSMNGEVDLWNRRGQCAEGGKMLLLFIYFQFRSVNHIPLLRRDNVPDQFTMFPYCCCPSWTTSTMDELGFSTTSSVLRPSDSVSASVKSPLNESRV